MTRAAAGTMVCLLVLATVAAQKATGQQKAAVPQKTTAPLGGAAVAAAKLCADPYQVNESATGWPEAPAYILFHRENSKAPWARNPAIHVAGEAVSAASASTLVCVEESRLEMGRYESGEAGYTPAWDITLVRLADRKVFFSRAGFYGKEPPGIKFHRGAGVGEAPTKMFAQWLPLIVNQKVARLKMRLRLKEFHEVSAISFSADGLKLVVAQEPRSTSSGTPPTPISVFDLATGLPLATWNTDYVVRSVAISRTGSMVAVSHWGHVEVWDVASARMAHKLDTSGVESVLFGPEDRLGTADKDKVAVWDVTTERSLHSLPGSRVALTPAGDWIAVRKDKSGITVQALESGQTLATFSTVGDQENYQVSGDAKAMARSSLFGATMYIAGVAGDHSLDLPNLGVNVLKAVAPMRDGFVFGNSDGIVGVATVANPQSRAFATDHSSISALAVSPDGKLVAIGDSSAHVSIWELL